MYRLLIGAAMALTATSSFAADYVQQEPVSAPRISGYVEGYLGGVWLHVDDPFGGGESESGWAAGGDGRVNFPINDRWNIQTDAIVDSVWMNHQNIYGYGGAVHAYWRDPSRFAEVVYTRCEVHLRSPHVNVSYIYICKPMTFGSQ